MRVLLFAIATVASASCAVAQSWIDLARRQAKPRFSVRSVSQPRINARIECSDEDFEKINRCGSEEKQADCHDDCTWVKADAVCPSSIVPRTCKLTPDNTCACDEMKNPPSEGFCTPYEGQLTAPCKILIVLETGTNPNSTSDDPVCQTIDYGDGGAPSVTPCPSGGRVEPSFARCLASDALNVKDCLAAETESDCARKRPGCEWCAGDAFLPYMGGCKEDAPGFCACDENPQPTKGVCRPARQLADCPVVYEIDGGADENPAMCGSFVFSEKGTCAH